MRNARILVSVVALFALVLDGGALRAAEVVRTAPYDFGCLGDPPCDVAWEPAQRGELIGGTLPFVCIVYGPPFVWPCGMRAGSTTGVYVETTVTGTLTVNALLHDAADVSRPSPQPTWACITLRGRGSATTGCRNIPANGSATLSAAFPDTQPFRWTIYVSVFGAPGIVQVDSISYSLE